MTNLEKATRGRVIATLVPRWFAFFSMVLGNGLMTEQNRNYIKKEIGKLLSEIWRIRGLSEQEYGSGHPITKKLTSMHGEAQALLQENPK
jgi:hypothetical protein